MVAETLLHSPVTPSRYIGSPLARGNTPARCGRVQQDQIILGSLLGSGGFGMVYVASMRGRTVAVKMYHKRCGNPRALKQSYNSELMVYRMGLKHINVVSVLGATSLIGFTEGAWIIMDYVGQKNLQTVLNDPHTELDCQTRLSYALQMARGLNYLHSMNLVHLDLKPANCLLSHDLRALRLADFGCLFQILPEEGMRETKGEAKVEEIVEESEKVKSKEEEEKKVKEDLTVDQQVEQLEEGLQIPDSWSLVEVAGTLAYRAPELLQGLQPSTRSDVYSLGITLWQMRTRSGPYEGVPPHAVVYQVVSKGLRPRHPSLEDNDDDPFETIFSDLYKQCWAKAEDDRPSSLEVAHAVGLWLDHIDS